MNEKDFNAHTNIEIEAKGGESMENKKIKVRIKYNDDSASWNNLSKHLISFLVESDELKKILCKE